MARANPELETLRVGLVGPRWSASSLAAAIAASPRVTQCRHWPLGEPEEALGGGALDVFVIHVDIAAPAAASRWLAAGRAAGAQHCVVISSAQVNEPRHTHPGHVSEDRLSIRAPDNPVARAWREIEAALRSQLEDAGGPASTILRPVALIEDPGSVLGRALRSRIAMTVAGHDPVVQLLGVEDLARALRLSIERRATGVYNVAPQGAIPLRRALRLAGVRRLPLPHGLHRVGRAALRPLRPTTASVADIQYLRYPWTVSAAALEREVGFRARSSGEVLAPDTTVPERAFDAYGQDKEYIRKHGRTQHRFLHDVYWRVEARGLEHIPSRGPAVLVGLHRGFMPFDAVMALHLVRRELDRYIRFLVHPSLVKQPYLTDFITRLGGLLACQENGDWVLERGGLLGVYPEGIRGAFSFYRDAYQLKSFGRGDYVRMALRNRAPIVPFLTLGSAEIFPILGRVDWKWWRRMSEWPFLPLTPTFPLLPLPLPSKWHTLVLPALHVEREYPAAAADDPATVREINRRVRTLLRENLLAMRRRRRHIFFGSIFDSQDEGTAREEET